MRIFMFYDQETNYQISINCTMLMLTGGYCISLPTCIVNVSDTWGMKGMRYESEVPG